MPRAGHQRTSALRRSLQADRILAHGLPAMRPCASCTSRGIACVFDPSTSEKCEQCTRLHRECDLAPPGVSYDRLISQIDALDQQILSAKQKAVDAEAKAIRLRKQKRLLQKRVREAFAREEENIKELEWDELAAEIAPPSGISESEQPPAVTSPTGLSQVSFGFLDRSPLLPLGSP